MCSSDLWRNDRASLSNILGEMIANGLMKIHSTTHQSPALVLIMVAWAYGWSWNWNWDKVPLLVHLLQMLGADWQEYKSQRQFEKRVLRLVRMRQHVESLLHPVILHLHESVSPDWDIMWTQMEEELRYLIQLHGMPLRLQDLARISIRKAVGGQHFKSRVSKLPLPPRLKAFVRADITRQLLKRVCSHNIIFLHMLFDIVLLWICFHRHDKTIFTVFSVKARIFALSFAATSTLQHGLCRSCGCEWTVE